MEPRNFPHTIRLATDADVPALISLLQELFAIEADFNGNPDRQERGLRTLLERAEARIWVADDGVRVVGMCTVQVLVSTAEGGPVGLIEDLVVATDRRGAGIGCSLLQAAENWAREHGLTRLQLLADRENLPALEFYRRQGWSKTQLVGLRKML